MALPRGARARSVPRAAPARAAAARGRLRRADDPHASPGRGRRDAPPEQPALHVALLRPAGRAADAAVLASRPQPCRNAPRVRARQFRRAGRSRAGLRPRAAARDSAARPVPRDRVRGRRTPRPPPSTRTRCTPSRGRRSPSSRTFSSSTPATTRSSARTAPAPCSRRPRRTCRSCVPRSPPGARASASSRGPSPAASPAGWDDASAPGAWHGMEMFLERQVRRSDPALERAYRNYEANLADTLARGRARGRAGRAEHRGRQPAQRRALCVGERPGASGPGALAGAP